MRWDSEKFYVERAHYCTQSMRGETDSDTVTFVSVTPIFVFAWTVCFRERSAVAFPDNRKKKVGKVCVCVCM